MKNKLYFLLITFLLWYSSHAHAQIITTIAGSSDTALGDGGPAINASLNGPYAVALDGKGNYYITDGYHNRIRKVDAAGIITTIAGTGTQGYNGDNIPATDAQIYRPVGITFDHYGNLYFCDAFNNRVRKIDTMGIITTIAGNGATVYNGDNILADSAAIFDPHVVAFDARGNMYITDWGNYRIRKVDTAGIITTIAGNGVVGYTGDNGPATAAEFNSAYGIVLDDTGNIYFADDLGDVVRKIDTAGIITTFAGTSDVSAPLGDGGPADSAQLNGPAGLAIDGNNNIYISDANNMRIRMVTTATGIITTIVGNGTEGFSGDGGPATAAELNGPDGITIATDGSIYFTDFWSSRVRRVGWPLGVYQLAAGSPAINICPNPATTQLYITASYKITSISISDLLGQVVYAQYPDAESWQVSVAGLPTGVYIVRVNGSEVKRFLKQ